MTAPRTYLFALMPGGKRPVAVARGNAASWQIEFYGRPLANCAAWWLVECESAEAGRLTVERFERMAHAHGRAHASVACLNPDNGGRRILASGGAR
jgi:hypothetical protein